MDKDSSIAELPGISQAGVMALHKLGINRLSDLLDADYERVAVVLDDFNEATRLLREARRFVAEEPVAAPVAPTPSARKPAAPAPAPAPPSHAGTMRKHGTRHRTPPKPMTSSMPAEARSGQPTPTPSAPLREPPAPIPMAPGPLSPHPEPRAIAPVARTPRPDEQAMGNALAHAARGLHLTAEAPADRLALARRLHAAATLLGQGAVQEDVVAALILEGVEQGAIQAASVARSFGERAASLVDECGTLRAVPVSPLGKLPKYYLEMAARSSLTARRICAAHQLAHIAYTEPTPSNEEPRGVFWYARLLLQALEAGGPDPIVLSLRAAVESAERAAA